jgi:hypothetical protein
MFFSVKASFFCEWLRGALLIPQSRNYNLEQLFISGAYRVCELTLIEAATLSPKTHILDNCALDHVITSRKTFCRTDPNASTCT